MPRRDTSEAPWEGVWKSGYLDRRLPQGRGSIWTKTWRREGAVRLSQQDGEQCRMMPQLFSEGRRQWLSDNGRLKISLERLIWVSYPVDSWEPRQILEVGVKWSEMYLTACGGHYSRHNGHLPATVRNYHRPHHCRHHHTLLVLFYLPFFMANGSPILFRYEAVDEFQEAQPQE